MENLITILKLNTQNNDALAEYLELITSAKSVARKRYPTADSRYVYYEQHHILPKSLYPDFRLHKENLVLLTAREHFIAHKLLTEIFPIQSMFYAYWRMCCCNREKCEITPEEYEYGRILQSQNPSFQGRTLSEESRKLIGQKSKEYWARGGYVHTKEQDLKMVETRRQNGSYNRTVEANKKCSATMKGRIYINNTVINKMIDAAELDAYLAQGWLKGKKPLSEEHKRNIGKAGKGKVGWNKGKPGTFTGHTHTEEAKQKMRAAKRNKKGL